MKNQVDADSIKIGIVGAGSWGTALANLLGSKGFKIDLWAFEKDVRDQIQTHRENSKAQKCRRSRGAFPP